MTEGVVTLAGTMDRRSETEIAVSMTRRIGGVVDVVADLTYRLDDAHLRPDDRGPHGVTEDRLRRP
ncbi:BON domain-containing protein [Streptomyces sp. NPDC058122]|uniref:BON domain-containing protein n=1 Tax=Streptomyces sp. NPDC058122 TaxID=3346349 RepID=UPI0036E03502